MAGVVPPGGSAKRALEDAAAGFVFDECIVAALHGRARLSQRIFLEVAHEQDFVIGDFVKGVRDQGRKLDLDAAAGTMFPWVCFDPFKETIVAEVAATRKSFDKVVFVFGADAANHK